MSVPKPVVLCILDGWGANPDTTANAPAQADTPTFDRIMADCPTAQLVTHGPDVGLPTGQMGNSEVGHTNIGAGRVVAMDLGQIDLAIEDGSFAENPALVAFADKLKAKGVNARVVSAPSLETFLKQDPAYRKSVVNPDLPVVAVEAAIRWGWDGLIGLEGGFVGMDGFGASAPAEALYEHFGITADAVVEQALARV